MNTTRWIVIFVLDDRRYALYLSAVERVVPAVEITGLPKAPDIVAGIINVQGRIIPVVDVRRRFRLASREPKLNDHIIIARTNARSVALVVDRVTGTHEHAEAELIPKHRIAPGIEHIEGVIKLDDGLVLIHDLETFLSLDEQRSLDEALVRDEG